MEKASSGAIPARIIIITLSLGVALLAALGMARLLLGLSLLYILIPGYLLVMVMLPFSDRTFI